MNDSRIGEPPFSCTDTLCYAAGRFSQKSNELITSVVNSVLNAFETSAAAIGHGTYQAGRGCAFAVKWIDTQIGKAAAFCGKVTHLTLKGFVWTALKINDGIGYVAAGLGYGVYSVADSFYRGAELTVRFVKKNLLRILIYLVVGAVIFAGMGTLYGFQTVACPFAVGFGVGCGFGGILGFFTVNYFDRDNVGFPKLYKDWRAKCKGEEPNPNHNFPRINTLWGTANFIKNQINPGAWQLALSISVTVVLATSVIYPHAAGGLLGVFVGNELLTKIGFGLDLPDPAKKQEQEIVQLRREHQRINNEHERIHRRLVELEGTNGQPD